MNYETRLLSVNLLEILPIYLIKNTDTVDHVDFLCYEF